MLESLIYIIPGIILLLCIYLIIIKQYDTLILMIGAIAVLFGFYFYIQIPENGIINNLGMLDQGYAANIQLLKIKSFGLFFIGGLMVLLGLIFISKKKK